MRTATSRIKRHSLYLICTLLITTLHLFGQVPAKQGFEKNRVIVLTDIEAEPDDTQSMVRLLLYSNQIDIKGIVATTSCWLKDRIAPESIGKLIQAYGQVQPNLLKHEPGFPEAGTLMSLVKRGLPVYGMEGVGDGKDSEGSEWIIRILEEDDDRPLWISVWGGANTLAQALHKIKNTKSNAQARRLIAKLRVYTISDQDDSGIWIRNNFPELFYVVSPGDDYANATWFGIMSVVEGIDNEKLSNEWLAKHIQQGHGPLGAMYPDVAYGMEGDTPSFLSLIPNGLNDAEHPYLGGWGGRYELIKPEFVIKEKGPSGVPYEPETRPIWTDASDTFTPFVAGEYGRSVKRGTQTFTGNRVSLWRWRDDFQNDFAARMDWCLKPYEEANHAPVPALDHPAEITVKSGQRFFLSAVGSTDPDGDNLGYLWFHYPEAGSYKQEIRMEAAENLVVVGVFAPEVRKKETAHFILRVTDKGTPQLSRYKRVVVTILPK